MDLKSGYLVGSLILGLVYLLIFLLRKDLRRELYWGGLLALPFAITAPYFIPEYWNPPYMFGLIGFAGIGIEDLLFTFFVGGIAAVLFEFLENKKEVKIKKGKPRNVLHLAPYVFAAVLLAVLEKTFPSHSIYNLIAAGALPAIYMIKRRKDLLVQSVSAGGLFALLYFGLFAFFNILYPEYVSAVYSHKNLIGVYWGKVPLEEILFAFATGACWSVIYEYVMGYKTVAKR